MDKNMKVIIKMVYFTLEDLKNQIYCEFKKIKITKENLKMVFKMEKEKQFILLAKNMKVNINKMLEVVWVFLNIIIIIKISM